MTTPSARGGSSNGTADATGIVDISSTSTADTTITATAAVTMTAALSRRGWSQSMASRCCRRRYCPG